MTLKGKGPVEYLNRSRKARMIEAFLRDALGQDITGNKILDVGSGNGQISSYFVDKNIVTGVDVEEKDADENKKYKFILLSNENLPFEDNEFDIVISHHVIEHVSNQILHLNEIYRVLKKDGVAYIGCPNGGSPFMAGHKGNKMVPNSREIKDLMSLAKFQYTDCYTKLLAEPSKYHCELSIGRYIPAMFIRLFKSWYPGHCFILKPIKHL